MTELLANVNRKPIQTLSFFKCFIFILNFKQSTVSGHSRHRTTKPAFWLTPRKTQTVIMNTHTNSLFLRWLERTGFAWLQEVSSTVLAVHTETKHYANRDKRKIKIAKSVKKKDTDNLTNWFIILFLEQVLNSTQQSLNEFGSGKVISLASKDLTPIDTFVKRFPYVFISPVQVLVLSIILWQLVSVAALAGVLYLFLIGFYLWLTYGPLKMLRNKTSKLTGERLTQIENTINAVRMVKLNAREKHFQDSIDEVRRYVVVSFSSEKLRHNLKDTVF